MLVGVYMHYLQDFCRLLYVLCVAVGERGREGKEWIGKRKRRNISVCVSVSVRIVRRPRGGSTLCLPSCVPVYLPDLA